MPLIVIETFINASPQVVYDLSRSVDLHKASMIHCQEEIIDGVRNGLMQKGDTVTWRAFHFLKSRTLKVKLTEEEPPRFFADEMIEGDFKKMRHEHAFTLEKNGTLMTDRFLFESPFGIIGQLANYLFLKNYMTRLLKKRNAVIKRIAESNGAKQYLHS
ncbi:SRPBCC family protein [Flavisolibacter nicotianae]|uniref:SRPBCC family protein n=1 Tax=Flavisolibacter nicotianae TaxID=2364882 RepID=UPI000EB5B712|nr:SRPBCC family protein [Flavisolibacter nicotianae]